MCQNILLATSSCRFVWFKFAGQAKWVRLFTGYTFKCFSVMHSYLASQWLVWGELCQTSIHLVLKAIDIFFQWPKTCNNKHSKYVFIPITYIESPICKYQSSYINTSTNQNDSTAFNFWFYETRIKILPLDLKPLTHNLNFMA